MLGLNGYIRDTDIIYVQSQKGWGGKVPLEIIQFNAPAEAGSPARADCTGSHPDRF